MIELTHNFIKGRIMERLSHFFFLLRVSHWSKAAFVMLGFCYSPFSGYLVPALLAALAFCLIASAVYIYNDIQDRSEDSLHPHKCRRPIASDNVSVSEAIFMLFLLLVTGLTLGWLISKQLAIILTVYLVINLAYNHLLKLIPVLDVACIATGFMLRVLAGTVGIGLPLSGWLTIAATLLSLFIALNKRRLEMQLGLKNSTRRVLKKYNPLVLNQLIMGTGIACFVTYLLYIIYARDQSYYFILTLPFAAIALWRFSWLSTQDIDNDDPVNVFLSDRLSRVNLYCFTSLTFMALSQ
jgi:4-hydroxybenzoate polyprenyltransferase